MKKPLRTAILLGGTLLALAIPALGQSGPGGHGGRGPHGPGPGGPGGMVERMTQELGLTDAQKTQLQTILEKYHSGTYGDTMKAFDAARGQVESLVRDPAATDQQILDATRQAAAQEEKVVLQRHQMALEINGMLTPEQRDKAKQLKAQGWGGPGRPGPPPGEPGEGQ